MTKEADIQIACNFLLSQLSKIYFFRHNEGKRSVAYKVKLKKMGFRSGAPDILIEYPQGKLLYVELKNEKGKLSSAQKLWQIQSNSLKTPHFVVKGTTNECLRELAKIIENHVPRRSSKRN